MEQDPEGPISVDRAAEDKRYMELLARKVEERMGRGPVTDWSQRDFQLLSEQIARTTREHISVTTLKRVLGRVRYEGTPYLHTLNMLSHFLGYPSWGQFKELVTEENRVAEETSRRAAEEALNPPQEGAAAPVAAATTHISSGASATAPPFVYNPAAPPLGTPAAPPGGLIVQKPRFWAVAALAVIMLGAIWFFFMRGPKPQKATAFVQANLSTSPITTDSLPQTVHFFYSGPVPDTANLTVIGYEPGQFRYFGIGADGNGKGSYRYSQPGYYRVKIFSNRRTLAETGVLVPSRGWIGHIVNHGVEKPIAHPQPTASILGSSARELQREGADTLRHFNTSYSRFRNFNVSLDAMRLSVQLQSNFERLPEDPDGTVILKLKGREGAAIIPMARIVPRTGFYLQVSDFIADSAARMAISPKFQQDFNRFRTITVESRNNKLKVLLDGKAVYEFSYKKSMGDLVGLELFFAGAGRAKDLHLYNAQGTEIWRELM